MVKFSNKTTNLPFVFSCQKSLSTFLWCEAKSNGCTVCSASYLLPHLLSGTIHHVVPQGNKNGPGRMALCRLCDILNHKRAVIHLSYDVLLINNEPETLYHHPQSTYNVHFYWAVGLLN